MAWPRIPSLIYTDQVAVKPVISWGKDAAGGRVPTYATSWSVPYDCSVSAAGANDVAIHSRENMVVTHVVTCNSRLGYIRDQLQWQETGAILTVIGVEPAGDAEGRIWNHYCEERPLR